MLNAVKRFDGVISIPCFGHKLNLAVHDVFKLKSFDDEPEDNIAKIIIKCKKIVIPLKKAH